MCQACGFGHRGRSACELNVDDLVRMKTRAGDICSLHAGFEHLAKGYRRAKGVEVYTARGIFRDKDLFQ